MKIYSTKSLVIASLVALFLLATSIKTFAVVSPPAACTAAIGTPANGPAHYITITWSSVSGATAYQLDYSVDGVTWLVLDSGTTITTYNHNTGSTGNLPFYYEVRTIQSGNTSVWTDATPFPIYNACNDPALPVLSGATNTTLNISVPVETPDSNTSYTIYAIYCTTTSQYVQADGSLGATAVFQTRATWGTKIITGLTKSTNYCFYSEAENNNGVIALGTGTNITSTATFNNSSSFTATNGGTTTLWYSPNTCSGSSEMHWNSGGCAGSTGMVGYTVSPGEYYGCFLRSPVINCTGLTSVTMTFDLTNSASSLGDSIYFYIWSNGSNQYYPPCNPCGSVVSSINGVATTNIQLSSAGNCQLMTVVFDLTSIPVNDRSSLYFYLNPYFMENAGTSFNVLFDNVTFSNSTPGTACLTTLAAAPPVASFQASETTICTNGCVNFTDETTGSPTSWSWTFHGATDSTSTAQNPQTVCYLNAGTFAVKLVASNAGGKDSVTVSSYITVNPAPPVPVITQSNDTLYCIDTATVTYQWYKSAALINGATQQFYVVTQGGDYSVEVTNANDCSISAGINGVLGLPSFTVPGLGFKINPNPATDLLTITGNWNSARTGKPCTLTIYNILGEMIYQPFEETSDATINIKSLPQGIYFMQITNESSKWTGRFVKE